MVMPYGLTRNNVCTGAIGDVTWTPLHLCLDTALRPPDVFADGANVAGNLRKTETK